MKLKQYAQFFVIAAALVLWPWLTGSYFMRLATLSCLYIMITTGLNLITGYFGSMVLGYMAYFGFGAYSVAIMYKHTQMPMMANIFIGGLLTLIFGALTASLCLRLRGPYFSIFTLALANILRIIASNWINVTNGPMGLSGLKMKAFVFGPITINLNNENHIYFALVIMVLLTLFVAKRFIESPIGRAWEAIREHEELAASVGISRFHYGIFAVTLAATIAGVAGGFYAYYITIVTPNVFAFSWMTTWLIMVITGGMGTLYGPVIGAILFTFIPELLRAVENWRLVVFGLLLIIVVLFMPKGVLPLARKVILATTNRFASLKGKRKGEVKE